MAWISRTLFSTSVKSLKSRSSACAASSAFCACCANWVKKMFFLGISVKLGMAVSFWAQKDRANGAVHVVQLLDVRRLPAPGPRRVRSQTSFADNSTGSVHRRITHPVEASAQATSRRIETMAPIAMTIPNRVRIPMSRRTSGSPSSSPLIITPFNASLA